MLPAQPEWKPSEILAEMKAIAGTDLKSGNFLFEQLFRRQLQADIALQLSSKEFGDGENFAAEADKLWVSQATRAAMINFQAIKSWPAKS